MHQNNRVLLLATRRALLTLLNAKGIKRAPRQAGKSLFSNDLIGRRPGLGKVFNHLPSLRLKLPVAQVAVFWVMFETWVSMGESMNKLLFAISTLTALIHSPAFAGDFCSTLRTVKDCAESSCTWLDDEQRCTDNSNIQLEEEAAQGLAEVQK